MAAREGSSLQVKSWPTVQTDPASGEATSRHLPVAGFIALPGLQMHEPPLQVPQFWVAEGSSLHVSSAPTLQVECAQAQVLVAGSLQTQLVPHEMTPQLG
jgi:hypothetical protein